MEKYMKEEQERQKLAETIERRKRELGNFIPNLLILF